MSPEEMQKHVGEWVFVIDLETRSFPCWVRAVARSDSGSVALLVETDCDDFGGEAAFDRAIPPSTRFVPVECIDFVVRPPGGGYDAEVFDDLRARLNHPVHAEELAAAVAAAEAEDAA